jgi:hypothetical protein
MRDFKSSIVKYPIRFSKLTESEIDQFLADVGHFCEKVIVNNTGNYTTFFLEIARNNIVLLKLRYRLGVGDVFHKLTPESLQRLKAD